MSSEKKDPGLSTGGSYFVPDGPFREFLLNVTDQNEVCYYFNILLPQSRLTKLSLDEHLQWIGGA